MFCRKDYKEGYSKNAILSLERLELPSYWPKI